MRDLARWRVRCAPRLCLDLHAPGALERDGSYVFATIGGTAAASDASTTWAERFATALGGSLASPRFVRNATYPSRWPRDSHPSFTSWAAEQQHLDALSLETSYQGHGDAAFLEADYRETGRRLADALSG